MRLEFWPEYGEGPLWHPDGAAVVLEDLGLPAALVERLRTWNGQYQEENIPVEGPGDAAWLKEGVDLLHSTRQALGPECEVVVTEPWWDEEPMS